MNDKKICFITCVNNEAKYRESLLYISRLNIPEGYEIESTAIRNASSMAEGYNRAMMSSDAKYKVYLHQDVLIINKNFIEDMLKIFESDNRIGMMGVIGAKRISTDAIWWNSSEKCGSVYNNSMEKMELLKFSEPNKQLSDVQAIDELLFATQYDIHFRNDIFDGWYFYGASQTMEFLRQDYRVVVPSPEKACCIHDCGKAAASVFFENYRKLFLKEYSKDLFPLVSILIPTYNQTKFLKIALESAINQTYGNIEIIIGDDSTTDEVEKFIKPYLSQYNNITYFMNTKTVKDFGLSNCNNCLKACKGSYVAYLLHDDVFHPEKISYMMNYFINYHSVSLVTSYRQTIDESGNAININALAFKKLYNEDKVINGRDFSRLVVTNQCNFIGEPSTAIFKKDCLEAGSFGRFGGYHFRSDVDVAMWLSILEHGDGVYIPKTLSYFRQHANQNSTNKNIQIYGQIDWFHFLKIAYEKGLLISSGELRKLQSARIISALQFINSNEFQQDSLHAELKDEILKAVNDVFKEGSDKFNCPVCGNTLNVYNSYLQYIDIMLKHNFNITASQYETLNLQQYFCPFCGAADRERLYAYYLSQQLKNKEKAGRLLDIAPAQTLTNFIKKNLPVKYITADLMMKGVDFNIDITDMQIFDDESFDVFICSHVLEHVPDDRKAISELYRILKKDGFGILMVPIDLNQKATEEDLNATVEERWRRFGQDDHMRKYAKQDFLRRIEESGFHLSQLGIDYFGKDVFKQLGLSDTSVLYVVRK